MYANQLIIVSVVLFFCLFVIIGMLKPSYQIRAEEGFKEVQATQNPNNVTQVSRLGDDESRVSKF